MPEIPRYVRYDFLVTLLGLLCIGSAWYFSNFRDIKDDSTAVLLLIGVPSLIWGFTEMYRNYADELDLKQLNLILDKKVALDKMIADKIISKEVEADFMQYLRKEFEEMFEKSKKRKKKEELDFSE